MPHSSLLPRRWGIRLSLVLVILLGISRLLLAQAGGGGSYSGGGGSGGGGGGLGGGGGGDGDWIVWLIWLHFEAWYIAIPIDIVLIWLFFKGSLFANDARERYQIRRGGVFVSAVREDELVEGLRARDPDFDLLRFADRVDRAFTIAQDAWCAQDLAPLRPFVSDGIHERFSMQIAEQVRDGWRQKMTDTRFVDRPRVQHVATDGVFDAVTVRIEFRSKITRVDRKTGTELPTGALARERFEEYWTFLRRRGVRTKLEDGVVRGLIEGNCPNCGAPLAMNAGAVCASCQGHIRSGQYDWVLTEITQGSEWAPPEEDRIPGRADVTAHDPEFTVAALEDRVSVIFWRTVAAERDRTVAPLAPVSDPAFLADREARWRDAERHEFLGDCAVGSVRLQGIEVGESPTSEPSEDGASVGAPAEGRGAPERAFVEVRWDGRRSVVREGKRPGDGPWIDVSAHRSLRRTIFEMRRPATARTAIDAAFTAAHCPGCGAPASDLARSTCAYCGAPLTVATDEWRLVAIHGTLDPEWQRRRQRWDLETSARRAASPARAAGNGSRVESREELVQWAYAVALGDGTIDPEEREHLAALARGCRIDETRLETIERAVRGGHLPPVPDDPITARAWIGQLARVVMADGEPHREEIAVLRQVGALAGLGAYDIQQTVRRARRDLFQEAKAAKRAARRATGVH